MFKTIIRMFLIFDEKRSLDIAEIIGNVYSKLKPKRKRLVTPD